MSNILACDFGEHCQSEIDPGRNAASGDNVAILDNPCCFNDSAKLRQCGAVIRSSSGVTFSTRKLAEIKAIDTLIVVGGDGARDAMHCADTLALINAGNLMARRLCSVCTGAFLLAGAGILDGIAATTHWRHAALFARNFPKVRSKPDRIFIQQGRIWTSAGVSAGIDLALALIAEDLGEARAKEVAREMVVYYRRPGGQSQFSAMLELNSPAHRFSGLLEQVRQHLDQRWTVERLAEAAHMSPRHFSRTFTEITGLSPAKAVERMRLEAARERVEDSVEPIEAVAAKTGFGDAERMRRAFVQTYGVPPQSLRRRAQHADSVMRQS